MCCVIHGSDIFFLIFLYEEHAFWICSTVKGDPQWSQFGWLGFNGTFSTNWPYCAIKKIKVC